MDIPIDLDWIQATMLASVRFAAFIVVAPPFNSKAFPSTVKAALSMGLALAVAPQVTAQLPPNLSDAAFFTDLFLQILIGSALGFLVYLVFTTVEAAGGLVDLFGGFQMAQQYDPEMNLNGAQFSRLFQMTAVLLMFTSGAYQLVLGGFAKTFTSMPLGDGLPTGITAQTVTEQLSGMFTAAVQIAGPLIIVLFLADLGLGLLTKVAPALNAFSLSYPLKIMLTLSLGVVIFIALPTVVQSLTGTTVDLLAGRF